MTTKHGIVIPSRPPANVVDALRNFVESIENYNKDGVWPDNVQLRQLADAGREALDCGSTKAASELDALQKENAELKAANDYNDTDKPLDEVMGAISDAVMDFRPDSESDNAGTIVERVKAAVELAKEVNVLRVQLEVSSSEEEIRLRTQNAELRTTLQSATNRVSEECKLLRQLESIRTQNAAMREALNKIASWSEGPEVTSSFDEPASAMVARNALAAQPEGKHGGV